jgi:capsular exopolysaccharide synthesis family protein
MELIQYWRVVRRWAWLIILCPLIAALAAGLISLQLPKVYEAKVLLYVRTAQLIPQTQNVPVTSDQVLRTYAQLMTVRPLLQQVISEESLPTDPVSLAKRIAVTPNPNTLNLNISVRDNDPGRAQRTANTLVKDFITYVNTLTPTAKPTTSASPSVTPSPTPSTSQQTTTTPQQESLVIAQPADLPTEPVSPRPLLNIALALLAGLAVGAGLAFLLDYMDQSVRSDEILRERVGLIPLGHISFVPAKPGRRGELVTLGGESPVVEAYKALRTNLVFSSVDKDVKTIVITSAGPSEGKSRTAANLAIVLAQAGHPTLLVDADFRRPSQHRMFGRVRNVGLSNLFVQDMPESALFVPDDQVKDLVILASGPTPPNPSELLGSAQMNALLSRFRKGFDYIVIDTPPVNAVTDASVLAANTDAAILVIDTNKATYTAVQHAKQALDRVGAKVLGSVMNKLKTTGGRYYYSEYGYGYGSTAPNGKVHSETRPAEDKTEIPVSREKKE